MHTVVLTHDSADAVCGAVAFAAAGLQRAGYHVLVDSRNLSAGERLWWELKPLLTNKTRSDGWAVYASGRVLNSPEALASLRHVMSGVRGARGDGFCRIALMPGSVSAALPAEIGFGQAVKLTEPDWPERARAAMEGRRPDPRLPIPRPYAAGLHHSCGEGGCDEVVLELRPLTGAWAPFFAAVPVEEHEAVEPRLSWGGRGFPAGGVGATADDGGDGAAAVGGGVSPDGKWWILPDTRPATRNDSYYLHCRRVPGIIQFGVPGGHLQYTVRLAPVK